MQEDEDFHDPDEDDAEEYVRPPDPQTALAKAAILEEVRAGGVFYSRQLEVRLERRFFHWITNRALRELINEGVLRAKEVPLSDATRIRFVWGRGVRYTTKAIERSVAVVRRYSEHDVGSACGEQADMLFVNAFATRGFRCLGQDVREFNGRRWEGSGHDLDFVIERDGTVYGSEVKNTLDYIERKELQLKVQMCQYFGIVPLMIMRSAPKSYMHEDIIEQGGYGMLFRAQIYPFGCKGLTEDIKKVLGLPAECPKAIPGGIMDRFLAWHIKR